MTIWLSSFVRSVSEARKFAPLFMSCQPSFFRPNSSLPLLQTTSFHHFPTSKKFFFVLFFRRGIEGMGKDGLMRMKVSRKKKRDARLFLFLLFFFGHLPRPFCSLVFLLPKSGWEINKGLTIGHGSAHSRGLW